MCFDFIIYKDMMTHTIREILCVSCACLTMLAMVGAFDCLQGLYYFPSWFASALAIWLGMSLILCILLERCASYNSSWMRGASWVQGAMASGIGALTATPIFFGVFQTSGQDVFVILILAGQTLVLFGAFVMCCFVMCCCLSSTSNERDDLEYGFMAHDYNTSSSLAAVKLSSDTNQFPCRTFWIFASLVLIVVLVIASVTTSNLVCTACPSCDFTGASISEEGDCSYNGTFMDNEGPCYCYVQCAIDGCHDGCAAMWSERCFYYASSFSCVKFALAAANVLAMVWIILCLKATSTQVDLTTHNLS
jgi:hypothetical protein